MLLRSIVLLLIVICNFQLPAFCNNNKRLSLYQLEVNSFTGMLIPHHKSMNVLATDPYFGYDLNVLFGYDKKQYWSETYNYPVLGLGFHSSYYNKHIGKPNALFGFLRFYLHKDNNQSVIANFGLGYGFNLNKYDPLKNPENVAIGSSQNVFIDVSTFYKHYITKDIELGIGIKYQHFSNGSLRVPNMGINMLSASFSAAYQFVEPVRNQSPEIQRPYYSKNEFSIKYKGSLKSVYLNTPDVVYYNSGVSFGYSRRISYKVNFGGGFDIFKNRYSGSTINGGHDGNYSCAAFVSSNIIVDKIRLIGQLGYYLYKDTDYGLPYYERLGLDYFVYKNIYVGMSVKGHAFTAEYLEWGFGVVL